MTEFQEQGPADNCVIHGKNLGWLSCTSYSAAMGIDWASWGEFNPSGCTCRRRTGDIDGGLTLAQLEPVIEDYGITVDRRVSWRAADTRLLANKLANDWGAMTQGNTGVLINTPYQSTSGYVNHCVWVQGPGYGWRTVNGLYRPDTVDVFDPAADGRLDFAQGPDRWPWNLLLRFAAALRPDGDNDPDTVGPNKIWSMYLKRMPSGWTAHVAPDKRFLVYMLAGDYIVDRTDEFTENGFTAKCSEPKRYRVHSSAQDDLPGDAYNLVELLSGSREGYFIGAHYAQEVQR